ncbi:MAG: hypothetical protein PF542_01265 [Nanoarchaeota archaeon]|jgi:hypothetical protein|nr:hypothetical protein [Nanoarchaeota archaeon]
MVFVKKFEVGINKLAEKFEHSQLNEKLAVGSLDKDVRDFVASILNAMLENYEDDDIYFGLVGVLGDLVFKFSDYDTTFRIWIDFDLDRVNEIGSGVKEEIEVLEELRDYFVDLKL